MRVAVAAIMDAGAEAVGGGVVPKEAEALDTGVAPTSATQDFSVAASHGAEPGRGDLRPGQRRLFRGLSAPRSMAEARTIGSASGRVVSHRVVEFGTAKEVLRAGYVFTGPGRFGRFYREQIASPDHEREARRGNAFATVPVVAVPAVNFRRDAVIVVTLGRSYNVYAREVGIRVKEIRHVNGDTVIIAEYVTKRFDHARSDDPHYRADRESGALKNLSPYQIVTVAKSELTGRLFLQLEPNAKTSDRLSHPDLWPNRTDGILGAYALMRSARDLAYRDVVLVDEKVVRIWVKDYDKSGIVVVPPAVVDDHVSVTLIGRDVSPRIVQGNFVVDLPYLSNIQISPTENGLEARFILIASEPSHSGERTARLSTAIKAILGRDRNQILRLVSSGVENFPASERERMRQKLWHFILSILDRSPDDLFLGSISRSPERTPGVHFTKDGPILVRSRSFESQGDGVVTVDGQLLRDFFV